MPPLPEAVSKALGAVMETQIGAYADIIQAQNELLQVTLAKLPQTSVLEPHLKQKLSILRMAEGQ